MSEMYKRIADLCTMKGVTITVMCRESGAPRGSLTDLKMDRISTLSTDTLTKIASYFGVSVGYLLGTEQEKAPTPEGEREVSDDELKFALWGDVTDITDDDLDDVRRYAAFIKERKKRGHE